MPESLEHTQLHNLGKVTYQLKFTFERPNLVLYGFALLWLLIFREIKGYKLNLINVIEMKSFCISYNHVSTQIVILNY